MKLLSKPRSRRAGFTLVEMAVSTAIFAMLTGYTMMVVSTGRAAADQAGLEDRADKLLVSTLERVSNELRSIIDETIWEDLEGQPAGSSVITFQALASLDGGIAAVGPIQRIEVALEESELPDGLDNDNDGLVDEHVVYLTNDVGGAGEKQVVLCRGVREYYAGETADLTDENGNGLVDEGGFHIERDGPRLIVRLTVDVVRSDGSSATRQGEVSIRIRN